MPEKRLRRLTAKAMANHEEKVQSFDNKLEKQWKILLRIFEENKDGILSDISKQKSLKAQVIEQFNKFDGLATDYQRYLEVNGSEDLYRALLDKVSQRRTVANNFLASLSVEKQANVETASIGSARSSRSCSSRSSHRKLLAVKAKAAYAEQAAVLERKKAELEEQEKINAAAAIRQKVNIDIDMKLLEEQKEVAIAEAEYDSEEEASEVSGIPSADTKFRTAEYVQKSGINRFHSPANEFVPSVQLTSHTSSDFTKFLLKKDILSSILSYFNDRPEDYQSWKATFKSVSEDIGASPEEEIDLLIKWLGTSSKRQTLSLKSAYINNPKNGLDRIWSRLDERFGSPESIYHATVKKLEQFPKLTWKDSSKLYDLSDILSEIEGLKENHMYSSILSYFDSAVGVNPVISKLPLNLQEKWTTKAIEYKRKNGVPFPPFHVFANFVHEQSRIRNDPSFFYDTTSAQNSSAGSSTSNTGQKKTSVATRKTSVEAKCPIHKTNHPLDDCRVFKTKSFTERRKVLKDNKLCFKCMSNEHLARECKSAIKCRVCESKFHCTAMHIGNATQEESSRSSTVNDRENRRSEIQTTDSQVNQDIVSRCTEIGQELKSCAKIVLLNVFTDQNQGNMIRCYAIIDEQSNKTLAKPELFDLLGIEGGEVDYCLNSCAGPTITSGRRATNCNIMSLDSAVCYKLPTMIECADIPCNKHEICTSDNAKDFPHLANIIDKLPQPGEHAKILLLLGRDIIDVHRVLDQVTGPPGAPFAQRLSLGWVVVGELCVGNIHASNQVNVFKTQLLSNGRPSLFKPCDAVHAIVENCYSYDPVFVRKVDDNQHSLSADDHDVLQIMDEKMIKGENGQCFAPLPFRLPRVILPNNCAMALRRARTLHSSLSKDPVKQKQLVEFMSKIIDKGHAEIAPALSEGEECWYLPIFGVTHPRKPGQVRGVFDSSATYQGVSLNSVLLSGPDLTNSLLGVLLRFRNEQVPVIADIEQMFYSFRVDVKHRNFLRFWWYKDNNPELELIEYRMCVHVFGNSPSPAVATYGLRKSVVYSDADVRNFVSHNFYVDDGVTSKPTSEEVISVIKRTQNDLSACGLHLHKLVSSNLDVIMAFDIDDLAKDIQCLEFDKEALPIQRSLGVAWSLSQDSFTFKVDLSDRPLTRRGILATVNSLFDPLGFVAPITIVSKLILRELMSIETDWDEPVPIDIERKFSSWRDSLQALSKIQIPRCYFKTCLANFDDISLHVFSDASEKAISAVAYVVGICPKFKQVSFVFGKSKVAPLSGHTIPRLELCAAVLAIEIADAVLKNIDIPLSATKFYSDSRVVLGYINNHSRRFHTYVSNRVQRIRLSSSPQQWHYICSSENPADVGSRGIDPEHLQNSLWFTGPSRLNERSETIPEFFPLIGPENDKEIRPAVKVLATDTSSKSVSCNWSQKFARFSSWEKLISGLSLLKHLACNFQRNSCRGWHFGCGQYKTVEAKAQTELFVLQQVQLEVYREELDCLRNQKPVPKHSSLHALDPFVDVDGLIKVGGRLRRSRLSSREKHPVLLPGRHHVSKLIAYYCHELVQHQGRLLTEGSIRSAGYWITGGKRLVASLIFNCVKCKKLRGKFENQKMSDLPFDRVEHVSPFSYVGVDVSGPWEVVSRRTRGGQACSKRWAVLFTCLSIRAVHIEVIEEMISSAFINALRRFEAIRGCVKVFRSDRGTNFVGSTDSLKIYTINVEDEKIKKFLYNSNCIWIFNPPHSSHFGGSWERMIGLSRRILESLLSNVKNLTHEVLVTLMAEVSAIINARPIVPVSNDCENPEVLSPSVLLTQKCLKNEHPIGDMDFKLMYKDQWKRVQFLADQFWVKWKREYLQTLQKRRFWNCDQNPVEIGDVVLLKDKDVARNCWPMGLISKVFPSTDGRIRKVEVAVFKDGKRLSYTRPIVDMVLLVKGNTS